MRIALFLLAAVATASAHIGSPNVFFEGNAGPYPIRVVIRPPEVVPGLAEINVRVLEGQPARVTALPVYFRTGRQGAPPPDVAERVRGDTNLFTATLWFMESGAYSIDVSVEGPQGSGTVIVPVNSVALTRNEMKPWFRNMLLGLGSLLFVGAVWLCGAAFGESILEPGAAASRLRKWISMAGGALVFTLALSGGRAWWNNEDRDYRNNRLYKPVPMRAAVSMENGQPVLRLEIKPTRPKQWARPIPDHGKLMHLFVVREPNLDAFAHLHPVRLDDYVFNAAIPPLPEGTYQLYADVTLETGFFQTLTATVQIPALPPAYVALWKSAGRSDVICSSARVVSNSKDFSLAPDGDDSWHIAREQSFAGKTSRLPDNISMSWRSNLTFQLIGRDAAPLPIHPYMGMHGHAVVRHKDGSVFAHVHPVGTFSMASQQFFQGATNMVHSTNSVTAVRFPYEFPRPGPYRIWVQLKSNGEVYTGVFDHVHLASAL